MTYLEGFVAAVPTANKDAYRKHAEDAAPLFREFGAARMVETWGDDVPKGEVTDFYGAVQAAGRSSGGPCTRRTRNTNRSSSIGRTNPSVFSRPTQWARCRRSCTTTASTITS